MVKWIHIADVHLGASPDAGDAYSKVRPQELWDTFAEVIDICEREQTDLLLIAGDLFHRQPLKKELKEVDYYFSRLSRTKVVLIAGNHDFLKQDSYYRSFQWSSNVYPLFEKEPECVIFEDLDVAVTGFSYESREILTPLMAGSVRKETQSMRFFWFTAEMKNIFRYRKVCWKKADSTILPWGISTSRSR